MSSCRECGQPHVRHDGSDSCARHVTREGVERPCGGSRMVGVTVCSRHGMAPSIRRRSQAAKTLKAMGQDISVIDNPLEFLRRFAAETVAWHDQLKDKVDELGTLTRDDKNGVERVRGTVELFERAMDRTLRASEALAKLNIDERLTRIEEAKLLFIVNAVEEALAQAGVSVEQSERARCALTDILERGRPALPAAPR